MKSSFKRGKVPLSRSRVTVCGLKTVQKRQTNIRVIPFNTYVYSYFMEEVYDLSCPPPSFFDLAILLPYILSFSTRTMYLALGSSDCFSKHLCLLIISVKIHSPVISFLTCNFFHVDRNCVLSSKYSL